MRIPCWICASFLNTPAEVFSLFSPLTDAHTPGSLTPSSKDQMLCGSVEYWWVSGYGWLKGDPSRSLSRVEKSGEEKEEEEEEEIGLRKGFAMVVGLVSCSSILFPAWYIVRDWRYG